MKVAKYTEAERHHVEQMIEDYNEKKLLRIKSKAYEKMLKLILEDTRLDESGFNSYYSKKIEKLLKKYS